MSEINNDETGQDSTVSLDIDKLTEGLETKQVSETTSDSLFPLVHMDIPTRQEITRSELAKWLVISFVSTMAGIFALILFDKTYYIFASDSAKDKLKDQQTGTKDLISLVLTAQSSLVGAAIGFYFGTRETR